MMVITVSKPTYFGSSIIKFTLIISYYTFKTGREYSFLRERCQMGFVCMYKSQVPTY